MRHLDEYRDPAAVRAVLRELREATRGELDAHGGLRRPDPLHPQVRRGRAHRVPGEARPWPRLPGLRHAPRDDRSRPGDRLARGRGLLLVRGHAARARLARRPALGQGTRRRRARRLLAPRRAQAGASSIPTAAWSSSPSASRPPRPRTRMAVQRAARLGLANFSVLVAHVLVPPALEALLSCPDAVVQGLLAPGHVCAVDGLSRSTRRSRPGIESRSWSPASSRSTSCAASSPRCASSRRARPAWRTQYARAVRREGNAAARALVEEVFVVADRSWRGLGPIPGSGLPSLRATRPSMRSGSST